VNIFAGYLLSYFAITEQAKCGTVVGRLGTGSVCLWSRQSVGTKGVVSLERDQEHLVQWQKGCCDIQNSTWPLCACVYHLFVRRTTMWLNGWLQQWWN